MCSFLILLKFTLKIIIIIIIVVNDANVTVFVKIIMIFC